MFPSAAIVEMLGHAGFDWVLLDGDHGSLSLADVKLMCMAADAAGITTIGRPRSNATADIQAMLDRGVGGACRSRTSTRRMLPGARRPRLSSAPAPAVASRPD